mgnify:CR=1 FL=1
MQNQSPEQSKRFIALSIGRPPPQPTIQPIADTQVSIMFEKLRALLEERNARFRVIHHPAAGTSESVAAIRGTAPSQGAKAMLCQVNGQPELLVLAILPGNQKIDFRKVGELVGAKKASLASPELARERTGCEIGAIPPFSFNPSIRLVADPQLFAMHDEIAFNAGRLDASMVLDSQDYLRIAQPLLADITKQNPDQ